MKSIAVTSNLTQLTRFGTVNAFLIREDDGFTLVDTMIKGSGKKLIEAPGHFPGPCAFFDTRDNALIAADAFSSLGGIATTAGPYLALPAARFRHLGPPNRPGQCDQAA